MADSSVNITPGSGVSIDTYQIGSGDHQQVIRQALADATTGSSTWTVSTTSANPIAAGADRVGMLLYNNSNVKVYLGFTTGTVTAVNAHWYLDAGDRYEVPYAWVQLPVSFLAASVGTGTVNYTFAIES